MLLRIEVVLLAVWFTAIVSSGRNISIVGDQFMVDGKPLQIVSGSIHYFRVPAEYWRDRLLKAKAAGLNAVSTYVEWNFHEPEEREYRFEGDRDVARFVHTAAEAGLLVLLRVGPYICAERDLGGLPYWLFSKFPKIKLRTTDEGFMSETRIWLAKLFEKLTPLLYGNGGPIILVQIENEYGSYGSDMTYKTQLRDIFRAHVGSNALLYTTDGPGYGYVKGGYVPETLTTIDFGPGGGDIKDTFKQLRKFMSRGPLMNSEFYTGWLTHWGENISRTDTKTLVKSLEHFMKDNNSLNVNMYVFHGGTNFEFSSGANTAYKPSITSYDYDAPLNEAGDYTVKYWAIRDLMIQYHPEVKNITPPALAKKGRYSVDRLNVSLRLLSTEGRSKLGTSYGTFDGDKLPTFEQLRQRAGLMLYETTLHNYTQCALQVKDPRDRIYVFVDGLYEGLIDRERKIHNLTLNTTNASKLSLLCENQGRINFDVLHDVKGIREVKLNGNILLGKWNVTGFKLEDIGKLAVLSSLAKEDKPCPFKSYDRRGPVFYEGILVLREGEKPLDTFINTTSWGKGYVWVNERNLGRYWPGRGPQATLYVPGAWLRAAPAHNTVRLLELERPPEHPTIDFIDHPIFSKKINK